MHFNMKGGVHRLDLNRSYKLGRDTHEDTF